MIEKGSFLVDGPNCEERQVTRHIPDREIESYVFRRGRVALGHLLDAYEFAIQTHRTRWDFAVEIGDLGKNGLTKSDLRWLVCSGFVEHARETTKFGDPGRSFQRDGGLRFSKKTCFVLTDTGFSYLIKLSDSGAELAPMRVGAANSATPNQSEKPLKPKWDRDRQALSVGDTIVKQFKVPAPNQEVILAVFEEEGWPAFIDDPLPPHPVIDPKQRLHDTINSLNRNQRNRMVHFRGNGSGRGILWELLQRVHDDD